LNSRLKLYWRTLDKKTISIWLVCFVAVNAVTVPFAVMYADDISNSNVEILDDGSLSTSETIDVDTIGSDEFADIGLISNSNEQLESYYVITSEGYLYTWGWNLNGELGLGTEEEYVFYPTFVNLDGSYDDKNGNGIRDQGEIDTITDGDKVSEVKHINKVYVNNNAINKASVMAISQEGYLYMWGDSHILPETETSEYKYSSYKSIDDINSYISPIFVNLDRSVEKDSDGNDVLVPARDIEGLLYKDSSNNIIDVNIPTKTEGDKVKSVDLYASSNDIYGGVVLSSTGILYGYGLNTGGTLSYDDPESQYVNKLTEIKYGASDSYGDIPYDDVRVVSDIDGNRSNITALGTDGYLYSWGNSTLVPTVDVSTQKNTPRVKIDLTDSSMSVDTSGTTTLKSFTISTFFSTLQAVSDEGYLYTLGDTNDQGAAGRGCSSATNKDEKFDKIDLDCNGSYDDQDKVRMSKTSDYTSYLISEDGYLYMYGRNDTGQLGQGHLTDWNKPLIVDIDQDGNTGLTGDPDDKVKSANINNANHSGAITESGELYLWGFNDDERGVLPNTSDGAFPSSNRKVAVPTKVNFSEYEEGELYTSFEYWNAGGVASTDYLNIYYWGGYNSSEERVLKNLKNVHKVSSDEFITNAVALK
ncbi:MAG: hypothetical protein HRS57_00760, partial [Mycoplasmataceae bacterium]|nr:hypothetical protein [Mycoplasmataceae bacterium]